MKKVAIVIVNWNRARDTISCLSSVKKLNRRLSNVSVVVVDNGSDGDASIIRRSHPWVTVLEMGKNLGFAGGTNRGIRFALDHKSDIVWLLNNDTLVDSHALSLLHIFDDPHAGVAGSKIYFAKGHEFHRDRYPEEERGHVIWYAGGIIDWKNMYASHRGVDEVDHGQYNMIEETPFVTGCSMMIRRDVFTTIGLFDEHYFMYLEDVDFCLRAFRAGFKILYVPTSIVWHVNAGSSGGPGNPLHEYYFTRNRLLLGSRYAALRTKIALWREGLRFLFGQSPTRRRAVIDALLRRYGKQYEPQKS